MTEYDPASITCIRDGDGNLIRTVVNRAPNVIGVAAELLRNCEPWALPAGDTSVFQLDLEGQYQYRYVRRSVTDYTVSIYERIQP